MWFQESFQLVLQIFMAVTDKTQTDAEVEHQHTVEAVRDITDPAEAGVPDPDHVQGAVHKLEMAIA